MAPRFTARLPAGHLSARLPARRPSAPLPAGHPSARLPARPPDPLCGLGYSPADSRQSAAEGEVCRHADRLLNMVHAYCGIRDSWTGWLRGSAMSRTLHERIVPEMRALRDAERRIVDQPSVTLLAVLDYAARARAGRAGVHTSRHDRLSAAARAGRGARGVRAAGDRCCRRRARRPPRRRPGVCRAHGLRDRARARGGSPAPACHEGGGRD